MLVTMDLRCSDVVLVVLALSRSEPSYVHIYLGPDGCLDQS